MPVINICAKCSNMFSATLSKDGKASEYDGYVPAWFPNPDVQHGGDDIQLEIDLETGQIVGWKKPTAAQLKETFQPIVN